MIARKRKKRNGSNNSRLNIVLAIIFLLSLIIIYRLFVLQVSRYDLYTALASDQHQVYNQLEQNRGKIYIRDNRDLNEDNKLYPAATNKDFALIYAVPKKVINPEETAQKLYEILDKAVMEKEVDELLANDEFFKEQEENENISQEAREKNKEFKEIKKELEIKTREEEIIKKYLAKLTKKNDPYEPIRNKVSEENLRKIINLNNPGLDYIMEKHRYYPEENIGSQTIGFVGYNGDEKLGQYGLEGFFNEELSGKHGSIKAERSAGGELIIVNDREFIKPQDGSDLILTINRSIQYAACTKLEKSAMRHGADGGSVIVMEPKTGAILAMCSWPNYNPNNYSEIENIDVYNNPAIFNQFEPGSIFKVITMAAGLDDGKISPNTLYNDKGQVKIEGWPKPIKNSDYNTKGGYGMVDMLTVLEESLNTGAIFVMEKIGAEVFADYVKSFGFGEKTGIELETETGGNIASLFRKNIRPVEAATATFGQGITVTSLQMITAYGAIANGGILMKPYLVSEIVSPGGERQITQPKQERRVISEKAAVLLSGMMVNVVDGGHAIRAGVKGYYVAGKTGTAQVADKEKRGYSDRTIHTFVGFAPVEDPKFVILVKLDDPKDVRFGASSAAPLFGEIAEFILNYYQVPKER